MRAQICTLHDISAASDIASAHYLISLRTLACSRRSKTDHPANCALTIVCRVPRAVVNSDWHNPSKLIKFGAVRTLTSKRLVCVVLVICSMPLLLLLLR